MNAKAEDQVRVFIPALVTLLLAEEKARKRPLTRAEVLAVRESAICKMMTPHEARALAERRGFRDIEPWNTWELWQEARNRIG